jgi:hypothetical protein
MITAAHCVHDDDPDDETDAIELLPAKSLSVMLGLHDKTKKKEKMRWLDWKRDLTVLCSPGNGSQ